MANKAVFATTKERNLPIADAVNEAGGAAYALSPEAHLAQLACTGTLNGTYYAEGEDQLKAVMDLATKVDPEFLAKTAIYARQSGFMKDMPALLCAILSKNPNPLLNRVFDRVVDNGKMIRNFVQIMRSGATGRKSLGSRPKNLVLKWLQSRTPEQVFRSSVGNDPSMADIIKMVHPKPDTDERRALYGWMIGREHDATKLPVLVQQFDQWKKSKEGTPPGVPFEMLTALELTKENWIEIARNASWTQTRMNLNTFARHSVFESNEMIDLVAARLANRELILKARVFPYQLMTAFVNIGPEVPKKISSALQDAMEVATENTPEFPGVVWVFPDVSGSMSSPVTGFRKGSTSKVRAVDVAALFSACVLRRCQEASVLAVDTRLHDPQLNPRDSVMTNANKLARFGGGGTQLDLALNFLNQNNRKADLVIFVSDNESWVHNQPDYNGCATSMMQEWGKFRSRNKSAKLVCINIQAYATTQASGGPEILNIGGFSDNIWNVIDTFVKGNAKEWVEKIKAVEL